MRTAFLSTIDSYPWGGADVLWTAAAEGALSRGDSLLLAVTAEVAAHPKVKAMLSGGAAWHDTSPRPESLALRLARRLGLRHGHARRLPAALARFRPDRLIISAGATYDLAEMPDLAAWLRASGTPFRYIANWQREQPELAEDKRPAMGGILGMAERVCFLSRANLLATERHLGVDLPNAIVVQPPVRLPAAAGPLPWPASPPLHLAAIARLEPVKGLDRLIPAAAEAIGAHAGWTLDIFGRGPESGRLQQLVERHRLAERIALRGYVADIDSIWREHHLFVSPALEEGIPLTIPEALLRGRPVLATRVGGAAEWIADERTGFLCDSASQSDLAAALRRAWNSREQWQELGRQAAESAGARYLPEDFRKVID